MSDFAPSDNAWNTSSRTPNSFFPALRSVLMPLGSLVALCGAAGFGVFDWVAALSAAKQGTLLFLLLFAVTAVWLVRRMYSLSRAPIGDDWQDENPHAPEAHDSTPDPFDSLRAELGFDAVALAIYRSPRGADLHTVTRLARQFRNTAYPTVVSLEQAASHEAAHAVAAWILGGTVAEVAVDAADASGYVLPVFPLDTAPQDRLWMEMVTFLAGSVMDRSQGLDHDGSWSDYEHFVSMVTRLISLGVNPIDYDGPLLLDLITQGATRRAEGILSENLVLVERLAAALVVKNKLDGHEVREILEREQ